MLSYLTKRLLIAIPTLIGVSLLVFSMIHLIPGDPITAMLGDKAINQEEVVKLRQRMGIDKPLHEQYFLFISRALKGDFGKSYHSNENVVDEFLDRFPATIELGMTAMFFGIIIGVSAGIIAAVKRYSFFDYSSMFLTIAGVSMPVFWLGLLMILLFSVTLGWTPVSGRLSYEFYFDTVTGFYLIDSLLAGDYPAFISVLRHLLLPALALSTIPMSILARITRASMLEVLDEDYVRTAKAKGCSTFRVIFIHTLRNAFIPVLTVIGVYMGYMLAGAILTETTFSWPGIGKWILLAVYQRDYPIVQFSILVLSFLLILVNLLVDMLYAFVNPKIRLQ